MKPVGADRKLSHSDLDRRGQPMAWAISDFADTRGSSSSSQLRVALSSGPARACCCARRTSGGWPRISASIS